MKPHAGSACWSIEWSAGVSSCSPSQCQMLDSTRSHPGGPGGSWIVYGLVAGLTAMLVTRWLAGRALSWLSVALALAIWLGIRLVWDWDADDSFLLAGSRSRMVGYSPGSAAYSPGPYDGSLGFLIGFSVALVLAATPWRHEPGTT